MSQLGVGDFLFWVVEGVSSSDSDSKGKGALFDSTEERLLIDVSDCGVVLTFGWLCRVFLASSGDTANTFNPFDLGVAFAFGVIELCSESLRLFGEDENCLTLNCIGMSALVDLWLRFSVRSVGEGVL